MSEFHIEVIKIDNLTKHPNADSLSVCMVHGGYPSIVRTSDFQIGDLAVYIPVDALCPVTNPKFSFLKSKDGKWSRIKASRLRGIFSMGLLVKAEPGMIVGQNVQELLGITKWEPEEKFAMTTDNESDPGFMPKYDIEGYRKFQNIFEDGEEVYVTEKLHGCNSRFVFTNDRLYVASKSCYKKKDESNLWWKIAERYDLENILKKYPDIAIYGEVYGGSVQDLNYGSKEVKFAMFDALDIKSNRYFDVDEFLAFAQESGLPVVPTLYRGPWSKDVVNLAEGQSTMADHVREGIVIKPIKERFHPEIGRTFLKLPGEGYLTR